LQMSESTSSSQKNGSKGNSSSSPPKKSKRNPRADNRLPNYIWPDCVQPNGKGHWGEWKETNAKHILVRSPDYITSRKKTKSKRSLFKLAYQEFIDANLEESRHIATHPYSWYKNNRSKLPKDTFYLIVSIQLQSINIAIISYYVMRTEDGLYTTSRGTIRDLGNSSTTSITSVPSDNNEEKETNPNNVANSKNGNDNTNNSNVNAENLKLYNELMDLQRDDKFSEW